MYIYNMYIYIYMYILLHIYIYIYIVCVCVGLMGKPVLFIFVPVAVCESRLQMGQRMVLGYDAAPASHTTAS